MHDLFIWSSQSSKIFTSNVSRVLAQSKAFQAIETTKGLVVSHVMTNRALTTFFKFYSSDFRVKGKAYQLHFVWADNLPTIIGCILPARYRATVYSPCLPSNFQLNKSGQLMHHRYLNVSIKVKAIVCWYHTTRPKATSHPLALETFDSACHILRDAFVRLG